jgi:hypothetical protein
MSLPAFKYRVFLVIFLMFFAVVLCGVDHGAMTVGETAHSHAGQAQGDHGCSSDPFVGIAAKDLSPSGPALFFLFFSLLLLSSLGREAQPKFSNPFGLHPADSLIASLSSKLYQRHAVYRI